MVFKREDSRCFVLIKSDSFLFQKTLEKTNLDLKFNLLKTYLCFWFDK